MGVSLGWWLRKGGREFAVVLDFSLVGLCWGWREGSFYDWMDLLGLDIMSAFYSPLRDFSSAWFSLGGFFE